MLPLGSVVLSDYSFDDNKYYISKKIIQHNWLFWSWYKLSIFKMFSEIMAKGKKYISRVHKKKKITDRNSLEISVTHGNNIKIWTCWICYRTR